MWRDGKQEEEPPYKSSMRLAKIAWEGKEKRMSLSIWERELWGRNREVLLARIKEGTRTIVPMTEEQRKQLIVPEHNKERFQVKKFLKWKWPLDVFAVCWEAEKNAVYAAMLPFEATGGCRIEIASASRTQKHSHDYLELVYVLHGELRQQIQDQKLCFQEGELCLIDPNSIHQEEIQDCEGCYLFLGIQEGVLEEALEEIRKRGQLTEFSLEELRKRKQAYRYLHFKPHPDQADSICSLLEEILRHLREDQVGDRYLCRGFVLKLLVFLCEKYSIQLLHEDKYYYRKLLYEEVLLYMESHFEQITLQDLVKQFRFQEDYFTRLLQEYSGLGYQEQLQAIRLRQAEKLICQTNRKIDEIVLACGYHNKGYFYKLFQEKHGMTPGQFRKKYQETGFHTRAE